MRYTMFVLLYMYVRLSTRSWIISTYTEADNQYYNYYLSVLKSQTLFIQKNKGSWHKTCPSMDVTYYWNYVRYVFTSVAMVKLMIQSTAFIFLLAMVYLLIDQQNINELIKVILLCSWCADQSCILKHWLQDQWCVRWVFFRSNKINTCVKGRPTLPRFTVEIQVFWEKNMTLCILKGEMPFKMHKIIFFQEK